MSAFVGWAVLAGLAFGVGAILVLLGVRALGPVALADRVAPAVAAVSPAARAHIARRATRAAGVLGLLDVPPFAAIGSLTGGLLSDRATIAGRQRRRGRDIDITRYRASRLVTGSSGLALGAAVGAILIARGAPAIAAAIAVPICGLLAAAAFDTVQERAARTRARRLVDELPVVLEFLAMSLAAGEGMTDALRRVSTVSRGELASELAVVVTRVAAGGSTTTELRAMADGLAVPALSRAVEQLVGALERGAPVAEVLRAQAQDAREDERARLIEAAGRTEVAMLFPLVLVILPATVVLAIWPGLLVLQLGF